MFIHCVHSKNTSKINSSKMRLYTPVRVTIVNLYKWPESTALLIVMFPFS